MLSAWYLHDFHRTNGADVSSNHDLEKLAELGGIEGLTTNMQTCDPHKTLGLPRLSLGKLTVEQTETDTA